MSEEKAYLAAGCFWGVENYFMKLQGVLSTRVGYTGGTKSDPTYPEVKTGTTGHAEVCEVVFDTSKTSYAEILDEFFSIHDPTQVNRQGVDVGTQYRSEIFFCNPEQEKIAKEKIAAYKSDDGKPAETKATPLTTFFPAEEYHQMYFVKNPDSPCIHECHRKRKS